MKRPIVFNLFVSLLLIVPYLVYNCYTRGLVEVDGSLDYGNLTQFLLNAGFSCFFFGYGVHIKDHGWNMNTLLLSAVVLAFSLVYGLSMAPDGKWIDFIGILDGTWLAWFLPVLMVYFITAIPTSFRYLHVPKLLRYAMPLFLVIVYLMVRTILWRKINYDFCHLGKVLFFLPMFYLGFIFRVDLKDLDYFNNYVRLTSWLGASMLAIVSVVFLSYTEFSYFHYKMISEASLQLACMGWCMALFAYINCHVKEGWLKNKKIGINDDMALLAIIPFVVVAVLITEYMIKNPILIHEMSSHYFSVPIGLCVFIFLASFSVVGILMYVISLFDLQKICKSRNHST